MRVMARISMPVEPANQAIKDGKLGALMQQAADRWHPEALYFTTFDGRRTAYMVFNMSDPSDIPPFAEPFFMDLQAEVELAPVMDGADLQKGLSQLG
jgi:Domain of unknown function (DUF3303)